MNNIDVEDVSWHNPYDQELREQESIKNGDIEALKRCWEEKYEGSIGLLSHDPLRHIKNLAIAVISISSRSAIAGGLNSESVFSMVDEIIMKIEHSYTNKEKVLQVIHDTQLKFTEMVNENNSRRVFNPIISKAKDYVTRNIHKKITIDEIANWLGVHRNYLSTLFSKSENKTLSQYIIEEKINRCCNILKYSDYPIQQIGMHFGFCTQSHFTKQFKKHIGMTPGQYRKKFGQQ